MRLSYTEFVKSQLMKEVVDGNRYSEIKTRVKVNLEFIILINFLRLILNFVIVKFRT